MSEISEKPEAAAPMTLGGRSKVALLVVVIAALASLYPFGSLVVTSLLPPLNGYPGLLWIQLFDQLPVGTYMLNSAIVSAGAMVIAAIVSCMAGYGFAKLSFPGSTGILVVIVAALSVPQATTIISNYFNFAKVGVPALYIDDGTTFLDKPAGYGKQKRDDFTRLDYHKPSDQVKPDWDLSGLAEDGKLLFAVGYRVAMAATFPEWKAGNEFKAVRDKMLKR